MMSKLKLSNVHKCFGASVILEDINLEIADGEFGVFVGPSGCGKSTLLRLIAGLDEVSGGEICIDGKVVNDVAPARRGVAMVFQSYALYPHMTDYQNMSFGLRLAKLDVRDIDAAVRSAAGKLHIDHLLDKKPKVLSGGQRQRVAIGRAIVRKPNVFLFDEPLSNLDAALRQELRIEIGVLVRELGVTAIYVTHDQVEAMTLGDRICLMNRGRVQQIATPREMYERPASTFVATFLGAPKMNLIAGKRVDDVIEAGPFRIPAGGGAREVFVGVRPEHVRFDEGGAETTVVASEPLGAETHLLVKTGGVELRMRAPGFDPRAPGSTVRVALDTEKVHVFERSEEGRRVEVTAVDAEGAGA